MKTVLLLSVSFLFAGVISAQTVTYYADSRSHSSCYNDNCNPWKEYKNNDSTLFSAHRSITIIYQNKKEIYYLLSSMHVDNSYEYDWSQVIFSCYDRDKVKCTLEIYKTGNYFEIPVYYPDKKIIYKGDLKH